MRNNERQEIRHAVILAAGLGGRLGARTNDRPKPLVEVAGHPLISHTIAGLAGAGITSATVAIGFRGEAIRAALAGESRIAISFAENPDYLKGASYSLRAARASVENEPFLLVMADHLLSSDLLASLATAASESGAPASVAADMGDGWDADYLAEATRLDVDPTGRVRRIGKLIEPWSAIDAGAFALRPAAWDFIDQAPEDCDLSAIFGIMAAKGALAAADITGASWYDVDTEEDLLAAEARLLGS